MSAVMTDTTTNSPAATPDEAEVHFKPSRGLPRELMILRSQYYLTVAAHPPVRKSVGTTQRRMIAYASTPREDAGIRLHVDEHGACDLWLGSTAFGVTESELTQIAEKFGIRVTRDEPQS